MTAPADRPDRTRSAVIVLGLVLIAAGAAAIVFAVLSHDDGDAGADGRPPGETSVPASTSDEPSAPVTADPRFASFGETAIELRAPDGTVREHCVLVADTDEQRARGLMEQTDLGKYTGMLFLFPVEETRSFWMRNTPMPLSIAFFGGDGHFVSSTDMTPCDDSDACPRYRSQGIAQFALEVPQGELGAAGATDGSTLVIGGACDR